MCFDILYFWEKVDVGHSWDFSNRNRVNRNLEDLDRDWFIEKKIVGKSIETLHKGYEKKFLKSQEKVKNVNIYILFHVKIWLKNIISLKENMIKLQTSCSRLVYSPSVCSLIIIISTSLCLTNTRNFVSLTLFVLQKIKEIWALISHELI